MSINKYINNFFVLLIILSSSLIIAYSGVYIIPVFLMLFWIIIIRINVYEILYYFKLSKIDLIFFISIIFLLFNTFFNIIINMIEGYNDLILNQLVSLIANILIMANFLIGRYTFFRISNLDKLSQKSLQINILIFSVLILSVFYIGDLYLARGLLIGQRYPAIVVFWSWYFFIAWIISNDKFFFFAFILGSLLCLLSLTRASYIQWFFCFFLVLLSSKFKDKVKYLLYLVPILIVGYLISSNSVFFLSIFERFSEYLFSFDVVSTDTSAGSRVKIWSAILEYLKLNPFVVLFGTGQLGPSYLPLYITDELGEVLYGTSAHSQYLDTLVRAGVIGLFLELFFCLLVIISSFSMPKTREICHLLYIPMAGILIYGLFNESLRWQPLGALFYFFSGLISSFSINNRIVKTNL